MYRVILMDDRERLARLEEHFFGNDANFPVVKECCEAEQGFVFEENNSIKAYLIYKRNVKVKNKIIDFYIVSVGVLEGWQGKGIGVKLIEMLGSGSILLHVKKNNQTAIHVYKKLGFIAIGQANNFFYKDDGLLFLRAKL